MSYARMGRMLMRFPSACRFRSSLLSLAASTALAIGAVISLPAISFADENGVSFWLPGLFGSLAAVPQQPGWAFTAINYYTPVSASGAVVHAGRKCGKTHKVREHHCDLATLGAIFRSALCASCGGNVRLTVCISPQGSDGVEQLQPVSNDGDAEVFQVLRR
jgi:hypothetical protein